MATDPVPFRIDGPDEVLTDLRDRLAHTRWPDQIPGSGWDYGTDTAYLRDLVEYWRSEYDWRAAEARLNALPQFVTEIDGQRVHFFHVRSPEPDAVPLVLTHGWPGSVVEFLDVMAPLADPIAYGGDPADAFHVVVPSLPGYGFSGPTHESGWDAARIADAWAVLMSRLGYERFGAQGGDWGAIVTQLLARRHADRLVGMHLNMVTVRRPDDDDTPLDAADQAGVDAMLAFRETEMGYLQIQATKPQSLGVGLNDSPAGLAAWIVEKFRTWSDNDGDVERAFTRDQLLTNVMVYWVTGTVNSANRLYYEFRRGGGMRGPAPRPGDPRVPTGCAVYPHEIFRPPRRWCEAAFDLRQFTEMPRGGHFAAMEVPELFTGDVRAFFRLVR